MKLSRQQHTGPLTLRIPSWKGSSLVSMTYEPSWELQQLRKISSTELVREPPRNSVYKWITALMLAPFRLLSKR